MIRRTQSQWRALFEAQTSSGLSAAVFCRQQSLCPKYFSIRKRQLGWERSNAFVQVPPTTHEVGQIDGDVRIRMMDFTVPVDQLSGVLSDLLR